jgi:DNA-binding transcriptional ArsR family regulator
MTEGNDKTRGGSVDEMESGTQDFKPHTSFTPEIKNPLEPLVDWTYGTVILGRGRRTHEKLGLNGTVQIGAVCEKQTDGKSLFGYKVRMDIEFPHIMFLCGKRGSGKSYSLGIFAEELAKLRAGIGTVIIDPIGTFWSLKNSNKNPSEISALTRWGLEPHGFKNILTYTPIGFYNEYKGIVDKPFSIAPADLTAEDWCMVFGVDRFKTQGLLIGDVVEKVRNGYTAVYKNHLVQVPAKTGKYSLGDIIQCIETDKGITSKDEGYAQTTRRSLIARFTASARWGLFSTDGTPITELSVPNVVKVLDVSHPKIGDARRSLIVGIIARKILEARLAAARMEDASAMGMDVKSSASIPVTWLLIDEAHLMLPHSGKTAASDALIEYAKLGRKPGCAMILATQRPAATNDEILSQVDLLIGHTLALQDDIAAFRRRVPAMLPSELGTSDFIRSIPVGIALLADQRTQKRTMLVQLRPRLTHHAGRAAQPVQKTISDQEASEEGESGKELDRLITGEAGLPAGLLKTSSEGGVDTANLDKFTELAPLRPLEPTQPLKELVPELEEARKAEVPEAPKPPKKKDGRKPAIKAKPEAEPVKTQVVESVEAEPVGKGISKQKTMFEKDGVRYKPENIKLDEGGLVLVRTRNPGAAFEFYNAVSYRYKSPPLSISRLHPDKVAKYFEGGGILPEIFWLSKSTGERNIGPTNLEKLAHQLNRHVKGKPDDISGYDEDTEAKAKAEKESDKPSVAILEGLEYLVSNNDFKKVLRFIEALHETMLTTKALGILPINPSTMDKRELEMLEREMDLCMDYSTTEKSEPEREAAVEEPEGESPPVPVEPTSDIFAVEGRLTFKEVKRYLSKASKKELEVICKKLNLSRAGTREEIHERLITYLRKHPPKDLQKGAKPEGPADAGVKGELAGEYRRLEAEREKLRQEHEKLMKAKLQRSHELEMSKLKAEREELKKIKKELGSREQAMQKKEKEYEKRLGDLERQATGALKAEAAPKPPELPLEADIAFEEFSDSVKSPAAPSGKPVGPLTVVPKLAHERLMDAINKKLDKNLFGRNKEEITSVQPVYLPMLKVRVKVSGGRFRRKDYENELLWDTISGELIIDFKNGLKRTEGVDALYGLSETQIKLLMALSSIRGREAEELVKDTGLTKSQVTRALNSLVDTGLIERKVANKDKDKDKADQYKRIHRLKLPGHPERLDFALPEMIPRASKEIILKPQFTLKQVQKVMNCLIPRSRIVDSEDVYYPFFMIELSTGASKHRKLFIDAVSGQEDRVMNVNA